jgi:hypothetical protein
MREPITTRFCERVFAQLPDKFEQLARKQLHLQTTMRLLIARLHIGPGLDGSEKTLTCSSLAQEVTSC